MLVACCETEQRAEALRARPERPDRAWLLLVALALLSTACSEETYDLFVDVRTDLSPDVEFDQVSTEIFADEERPPVRTALVSVSRSDDFATGHRVAELSGLARGAYTVSVTLLDGGGTVASSRRLVQLEADRAMTFEFDARCAGVVCPGLGDPADAVQCVAGICVSPTSDAGTDTGLDTSSDGGADAGELTLLLPPSPINVNANALLAATGGVAPYSFSLVSGEGSVEETGALVAPNYGGRMQLRVTDDAGDTADATLDVGGASLFALGGYHGTASDQVFESEDGDAWASHLLPGARGEVAAVVFQDALYMLGGWNAAEENLDTVVRSDSGRSGTWVTSGRLPAERGWGGAVVHDGRIIYSGGRDDVASTRPDVYASPDGATWSKIGELPQPSSWGGLATFHGQLFYLGGLRPDSAADVIWTSPDGGSWTVESETLPEPRAGGAIVIFDDRLWYIGGRKADLTHGDQIWSSENGLDWVDTGVAFPTGFRLAAATVHRGRMWIVGGNTGSYSAAVYQSTDGLSWTRGLDLPVAQDHLGLLSFTPPDG